MLPKFLSRSNNILITIGLLLPLLLIGIPALLAHRAERDAKKSFQWVTHTLEVDRAVQNLLNSLVDAETGQRGFLLTQRAVYLEPYTAGRARIVQQLAELRTMTADNPAQQERLREVEPLISDRMGVLAETIAMENLGDHEGALTLVNSDRGKNTMDRIRGILRLMGDDEQRLLWIRQRQYTKDAGRSTALLYTLLAASAACALFVLFLLRRLSKIEPIVHMCASSRTIEYGGEWVSFEQYLKRRFNIETSHGMSPAEFERLRGRAAGPSVAQRS
jgi:CHASE3 domain sensor protein